MERESEKFNYRVYLKSGEVVDVEGVSFVSDYETEIRLNDEGYNPVCIVSKSEYECILKVE